MDSKPIQLMWPNLSGDSPDLGSQAPASAVVMSSLSERFQSLRVGVAKAAKIHRLLRMRYLLGPILAMPGRGALLVASVSRAVGRATLWGTDKL